MSIRDSGRCNASEPRLKRESPGERLQSDNLFWRRLLQLLPVSFNSFVIMLEKLLT